MDFAFGINLKSSVDEARQEFASFIVNNSGLDVRGINVEITPIDNRRKRRAVDVTHNLEATVVHFTAEDVTSADEVTLPIVDFESENFEIANSRLIFSAVLSLNSCAFFGQSLLCVH